MSSEGPVRRRGRSLIPRRSTTRVVGNLEYAGRRRRVYTNIATPEEERVFFLMPSDPVGDRVPFGTAFRVTYNGREYTAHKRARHELNRIVPVGEFILPH